MDGGDPVEGEPVMEGRHAAQPVKATAALKTHDRSTNGRQAIPAPLTGRP